MPRVGSWREPEASVPFPIRGEAAAAHAVEAWERIEYREEQATRAQLEVETAALVAAVQIERRVWRREILVAKKLAQGT